MYDLWLTKGISVDCETGILTNEFSHILTVQVFQKLREHFPGFLGLNIHEPEAKRLLTSVIHCRARGLIISQDYRSPIITLEKAAQIARQYITDYRDHFFPGHTLREIQFLREHAMWWTFGASVVEFVDADKIPSALYACIDKLDGHVWEPDEMEQALEAAIRIT